MKKLPPILSPILRCKHGDEYPDDKKHSIVFDGDKDENYDEFSSWLNNKCSKSGKEMVMTQD